MLSDTPLSLEQQQYVSMIVNSGRLLLTIINDILDYSSDQPQHNSNSQLQYNESCSKVIDYDSDVFSLFVVFCSKIEAGQLNLLTSPQNVCDICESAIMLCYDLAVSKGLTLSWFIEPSLPSRLMIDSARMQQILINLMSNGQSPAYERWT